MANCTRDEAGPSLASLTENGSSLTGAKSLRSLSTVVRGHLVAPKSQLGSLTGAVLWSQVMHRARQWGVCCTCIQAEPDLASLTRKCAPVWYRVAMSHWCARRDQLSEKRRWLRSWLSTGTERPVRILRQMPRATCSPAAQT